MTQKTFPASDNCRTTSGSSGCAACSKRRQANAPSNGGAFGESSRHLRPNAIVAAGGPAPIHRRSEENSGNRPLLLQTVYYLEKCSLSNCFTHIRAPSV